MIKSITIRDVASFDHEGVTLDNLQRVNIIYGGNGTGKTTISRVLGSNTLEYKDNPYKSCEIKCNSKQLEVFVYNQDIKKYNLKESNSGYFFLDARMPSMLPLEKIASRNYEIMSTVNDINKLLRLIGFTGFKIRPSFITPSHYQIDRADGSRADETLSEGEITIITFLFFIKMVYESYNYGFEKKSKVVVVDDPICSLDSDVMFVVSEMKKQLMKATRESEERQIKKASHVTDSYDSVTKRSGMGLDWHGRGVKQVFVLTHNMYFHRMLCYELKKRETHFWILRKRNGVSKLTDYGKENPIEDEYAMQWREIREAKKEIEKGVFNSFAGLPNIMRQILERYFSVYGGYERWRLIPDNFSDNFEETVVARSLMKWVDEGSHATGDGLYLGHPAILAERYLEVFHQLFVKLGHEAHYKMMMRED